MKTQLIDNRTVEIERVVEATDFGLIPNDPSPAAKIQAAINWAATNKRSTVLLPDFPMKLEAIIILTQDMEIRGPGGGWTAMGGLTDQPLSGSAISTVPGITTAFRLDGRSTGFKAMGARFTGIRFEGSFLSGAGSSMTRAIASTMGNGPARPVEVDHCQFIGLTDAIYSDVPAGQTTGIWLNCHNNVFQGGYRSLGYNAAGGDGAYTGLMFRDNVSEQGAVVDIGLLGPAIFEGNLLEGQAGGIKIRGGLFDVTIRGNYWEANTGYYVDVEATSGYSTLNLRSDYSYGSGIECKLVNVNADVDVRNATIVTRYLSTGSVIGGDGLWKLDPVISGAGDPYCGVFLDPIRGLPPHTVPPNSIATVYATAPGTLNNVRSPLGKIDVGNVTNGYSTAYTAPAISLSAGQQAVISALVRITAGSVIGWEITGPGYLTGGTQRVGLSPGRWTAVAIPYRAAGATGNLGFRWHADPGTTLEFSDISICKVATNDSLCWSNPI